MPIVGLSKDTITLLKSGQVISNVSGAVKELIENSLDAGATTVEVRLDEFGFGKIEVRDNGTGVDKTQVPAMVQPHTTSKISSFSDLGRVLSYGFRGEALSSLCAVSNLKIITKTKLDLVASTFSFNHNFAVDTIESQAGKNGTTVIATNLFANIPVRKQFYKDPSRRKEELKKIERYIAAFSIINPTVRFSLFHNKNNIFSKIPCADFGKSFAAVLGQVTRSQMEEFTFSLDPQSGEVNELHSASSDQELNNSVLVQVIMPKLGPGMVSEFGRSGPDKTFLFINKRPVEMKALERLLRRLFSEAAGVETEKFPVSALSIQVGQDIAAATIDHNLEPNKQKVGLGCMTVLLDSIEEFIRRKFNIYKELNSENTEDGVPPQDGNEPEKADIEQQQEEEQQHQQQQQQQQQHQQQPKEEEKQDHQIEHQQQLEEHKDILQIDSTHDPEPCFTLIGSTQHDPDTDNKENQSVSQFFSRVKDYRGVNKEEKSFDRDRKSYRSRSPVLRPEMFETPPDLPGIDAVYINRLKDGDFTEVEEEAEDKYDYCRPSLDLTRNPFIQLESEEGPEPQSENEDSPTKNILDDFDKPRQGFNSSSWATGNLMGRDGKPLEPVKLVSGLSSTSTESPKPRLEKKRKLDETTPRIDQFLANVPKKIKQDDIRQENFKDKHDSVTVSFSLQQCRAQSLTASKESIPDQIVGPVNMESGDCWLYTGFSEIQALYPIRLKERMIYDRLLASHPLPFAKLSQPLIIYPGRLDDRQLSIVTCLYTNTKQCPARITDRRITFNGLDLVRYDYPNEGMIIKLEGRNTDIPFYGLSDLLELIDLIAADKEDKVSNCRPSKVREFLRTEATRIMREEASTTFGRDEVAELISYKASQATLVCSHDKPVSSCLHEFKT